jgi:hypothetical protein
MALTRRIKPALIGVALALMVAGAGLGALALERLLVDRRISIGGWVGAALLLVLGVGTLFTSRTLACATCRKHLVEQRIRVDPAWVPFVGESLRALALERLRDGYATSPVPPVVAGATMPVLVVEACPSCRAAGRAALAEVLYGTYGADSDQLGSLQEWTEVSGPPVAQLLATASARGATQR